MFEAFVETIVRCKGSPKSLDDHRQLKKYLEKKLLLYVYWYLLLPQTSLVLLLNQLVESCEMLPQSANDVALSQLERRFQNKESKPHYFLKKWKHPYLDGRLHRLDPPSLVYLNRSLHRVVPIVLAALIYSLLALSLPFTSLLLPWSFLVLYSLVQH